MTTPIMQQTGVRARAKQRNKLARDVEKFLAKGNQITKLPGFGQKPADIHVGPRRFALRGNERFGID